MSATHRKEVEGKTISVLMNIINEYGNDINQLKSENSELAIYLKVIQCYEYTIS